MGSSSGGDNEPGGARSDAVASLVLARTSDIVLTTDPEGRVNEVNAAFERVSGFTRQEVLGANLRELCENEPEPVYTEIWSTLTAGAAWRGRVGPRKKDGSQFIVDAQISPILDAAGAVTQYVCVGRDLTELVEAQSRLHEAERLTAVGRLATGVAHDFNNVLTRILMRCHFIELDLAEHGTDSMREDLGLIVDCAENAANLTQYLLAFSGKQMPDPRPLDLNEVVGDLAKLLRRVIGERVDFVLDLGADLHPVMVDPGQVAEVLLKLAIQACDDMPRGGNLRVETRGRDDGRGGEVLLVIHGDGPAVSLGNVPAIVHQWGGKVVVHSEAGHGTTVEVCVPAADATETPSAAVADAEPRPEVHPRGTVLIAEDEDRLRELLTTVLQREGFTVLEGANAEEALGVARDYEGAIDLLVTDIVMPGDNGCALATRLVSDRPEVSILYVSGFADETIARLGVFNNGVALLRKPFTAKAFVAKVSEALALAG